MRTDTTTFSSPAGRPAHPDRAPLYGPEFAADPHRVYAALRRHGPVAPVELAPGVPAFLVISYDAALDVLRDPGTFPKDPRRWQEGVPADCPVLPFMMYRPACNLVDGADHARLRGAVADSMSRIDVNTLRESVERNAETLIGGFAANGEADLRAQYAMVLPMLVFNEILGCPREIGDRVVAGMQGLVENVDTADNNDLLVRALAELVALKHRRPGEDLTSWLIAHPARLTDEEVIHQLVLLVGLATEPEQNLIANALLLLLSDDRFAGDLSGGSLSVGDALEEVLWTDPPIANWAISYPAQEVDFRGVRLPADQPVVTGFAAANTDPATVSAHRAGNRAHLAWGAGPHTCPAQGQARLIASLAVEELLDTLPGMELAVPPDRLRWRPGFAQRALQSLPVRFPPATAPFSRVVPHAVARAAASPYNRATGAGDRPSADPAATPHGSGRPDWWNGLARWWRGE